LAAVMHGNLWFNLRWGARDCALDWRWGDDSVALTQERSMVRTDGHLEQRQH
jgi:hypothetical protein